MNAGIAQGFIRFGTLAHQILILMHETGHQSNSSLTDTLIGDLADPPQAIAVNLQRLLRHGFIFVVGKDRPPVGRSHRIYGLTPQVNILRVRKMTPQERTAKYRARRALQQTTSVFTFRGSVQL